MPRKKLTPTTALKPPLPAVVNPDRAPLEKALAKGQNDIVLDSDVKSALAWATRVRRESRELDGVLSGRLALRIGGDGKPSVAYAGEPKASSRNRTAEYEEELAEAEADEQS